MSQKIRLTAILALLAAVSFSVWSSLTLYLGMDPDCGLVLESFQKMLTKGEYIRSRTAGFPLFEIPAVWFFARGGIPLVNLFSTLWYVVYAAVIWQTVGLLTPQPWRRLLAFLVLILNPLVLINASIPMETSEFIALTFLFTYLVLRWKGTTEPWKMAICGLLAYAVFMTRIDSLAFIFGLYAYILAMQSNHRARVQWTLVFVIAGLTSLATYGYLNGGLSYLDDKLTNELLWRRLLRAAIQPVNLMGFSGLIAVGYALWKALPQMRRLPLQQWPPLETMLWAMLPLVVLRFATLPDELEYLIAPYLLCLLLIFTRLELKPALACLLAILLLSQHLVTLSLFERKTFGSDKLSFSPHLNAGVLYQESWGRLLAKRIRLDENYRQTLADTIFASLNEPSQPVQAPESLDDYLLTPHKDVLVSDQSLHEFNNSRLPTEHYSRQLFGRLIGCNQEIFPRRSWRLLQPFRPLDLSTLQCRVYRESAL